MTKKLYIIAGPNGSGKTTLANELVKEDKIAFLNADEIAKKRSDTIGIKSGRILLEKLDKLLVAGDTIVLESTISGAYHFGVMERAKRLKYEIIFIYIFLDSVEQNLLRIKQRVTVGGHDVPETDVRRRYERSMANFWPTALRASHWALYYNGEDNFEPIAQGRGENIDITNEATYNKFNKGIKYDKK